MFQKGSLQVYILNDKFRVGVYLYFIGIYRTKPMKTNLDDQFICSAKNQFSNLILQLEM